MTPYWIHFSDRSSACIEANNDTMAMEEAARHGTPISATRLPYPAKPRLGPQSDCPPFCFTPTKCVGRGSCPQAYACSE